MVMDLILGEVKLKKVNTVVVVRERKKGSHHDKGFIFGVFANMHSARAAYGNIDPEYEVTFDKLDVMQA
jgi:hypothetical protein